AFARRDSTDDLRLIRDGLRCVECRLFPGESLKKDFGIFVDEYAHFASPTTFSAASRIPSATVKLNPDSIKIFRPSSTLVPSMRITMGTLTARSRAAATTPVAKV